MDADDDQDGKIQIQRNLPVAERSRIEEAVRGVQEEANVRALRDKMNRAISRRNLLQASTAAALAVPPSHGAGANSLAEGPATPKLCLQLGLSDINETGMRRLRQIGIDHVLMGGPAIPWTEEGLRSLMDSL